MTALHILVFLLICCEVAYWIGVRQSIREMEERSPWLKELRRP